MPEIPENTRKALGLTDLQARVYLAALELGEASMQALARKSGVKRTSIYNFIDELKKRHLIVETRKGKRSVYSAAHPKQLIELERTRLVDLEQALPELLAVYNQSDRKPRVMFYEGVEGVKEVYADTVSSKKPIIAWSDFEHMQKALGSEFVWDYPEQRAKQNITFKSILRDSAIARELAKKNIKHLRETKLIPDDIKTEINVYGDKVAMMSFRSRPPFAVLIQDQDLADTLRIAWQRLWERLA